MKQENIVTPQGVLVYPHLNKADTKFDKNGVFKSGLRLEKESSENLIKQIVEKKFGFCWSKSNCMHIYYMLAA